MRYLPLAIWFVLLFAAESRAQTLDVGVKRIVVPQASLLQPPPVIAAGALGAGIGALAPSRQASPVLPGTRGRVGAAATIRF